MKKLVVLTGAGMSADSGLATFRDSGGLWEGYDIEEVASIGGWRRDPEKVLEFYNLRREQAMNAEPNEGHFALVELEERYDVTVITQNVDDLHERAGSGRVIHLHGELRKARSSKSAELVYDIGARPIRLGDKAGDGAQLRPHIVWFGEMVPEIMRAAEIAREAELLVVIGTSLAVYPAAGLINEVSQSVPCYMVDPSEPGIMLPDNWTHYRKKSATGTPLLVRQLMEQK